MPLTEQQIKRYTGDMLKAAAIKDTERSHEEMDEVLMNIAEVAGCKEVVKIFNEAKKYYS